MKFKIHDESPDEKILTWRLSKNSMGISLQVRKEGTAEWWAVFNIHESDGCGQLANLLDERLGLPLDSYERLKLK